MKPQAYEQPFLTFKFLRNAHIDLGNDVLYQIDPGFGHKETPYGPMFTANPSLDKIFKVELADERAHLPVKRANQSERSYNNACDAAYKVADSNRDANSLVRSRIKSEVKFGTIEIIDDPFATLTTPEEVGEMTEIESEKAAKKAAKKPAKKKPAKAKTSRKAVAAK